MGSGQGSVREPIHKADDSRDLNIAHRHRAPSVVEGWSGCKQPLSGGPAEGQGNLLCLTPRNAKGVSQCEGNGPMAAPAWQLR
ncbi:hypothetical protein V2G26_003458 [Clonostachys chloroleuca]